MILAGLPATTLGRDPVAGHNDAYTWHAGDTRKTLTYHFPTANPSWFDADAGSELESRWEATFNNSNVPKYNGGTGGGTVSYDADTTSPCTGSTTWIGCNPAPGLNGFEIHVRSLPDVKQPTWMWYHRSNTCSDVIDDDYSTSVCFSVQRVIAHESEHNTMVVGGHDESPYTDTIMQSVTPTPSGSADYWNQGTLLRCDLAGAQLDYGLADPAGKYADCFATTPGDGTKGLNTTLTVGASSYTRCYTSPLTVSGRFALATKTTYKAMSNTPLAGRAIKIERKPSSGTTWTLVKNVTAGTAATGNNWTTSLTTTTSGLYNYRATWATSSSETGLNSSNTASWNVGWTTSGCPLVVGE